MLYRGYFRKTPQQRIPGIDPEQQAGALCLSGSPPASRTTAVGIQGAVDKAPLMNTLKDWFKKDYSPDHIAGRLMVEYPQQGEMLVSHQEITEEQKLKGHFRHPRAERKARGGAKDLQAQIPDRKLIDTRPEIVNTKNRVGDWEGDTVEGAGKTAYLATFVDNNHEITEGKSHAEQSGSDPQ
jgi:IS30 family transposase